VIVEMTKVTIAMLAANTEQGLQAVGAMGVLHIQPVQKPASKTIRALRSHMDANQQAIDILTSRKARRTHKPIQSSAVKAETVLAIVARRERDRERLAAVANDIEVLKPLGDFQPSDFELLKESGLFAKIYRCTNRELKKTEFPVADVFVVAKDGADRYVLALSRGEFSLPFKEIKVPALGLRELKEGAEEINELLATSDAQLDRYAAHVPDLKHESVLLADRLAFAEAVAGMGREGTISYLTGYVPADDLEPLKKKAQVEGWALMLEEPSDVSEVPTLTKNPAWIRIVKPVFNLMGALPGYQELDVSFWFLLALSLFFAMLIGDGGYGLLFLLGTMAAHRRYRSAPKEPFILLYVLSAATVIWGLLTGNWFGSRMLSESPWLHRFIVSRLDVFSDNQDFMMRLCFVLGAVHLSIAHLLRTFRQIKSLRALGDIGWICILWVLYLLALHLVMGDTLSPLAGTLALAGVLLGVLFDASGKNFLTSSLAAFAQMPLKVVTSFSDLVSYLRIFAVGYATLIVAVSFNELAFGIEATPLLKGIGTAFVLLVGHTINIMGAAMAVLVHGVRLNMLEFSSHLGMAWSGHPYKPFTAGKEG
jgi:V/A-type H+-transporting ATPase subunit I